MISLRRTISSNKSMNKFTSKYHRSLIVKMGGPALLIAACIFFYINAGSIPAPGKLPGHIGPAFWPRAILMVLIICSLVKIFNLWRHRHISAPTEVSREVVEALRSDSIVPKVDYDTEYDVEATEISVELEKEVKHQRSTKTLIIAILLVLGFVLAMDILGFLLSCLFFLWTFTYLGGWRKKLYLPLITVLGTLFINFLFVKWVYIPLPKGKFFFEDITIAIYKAMGIF